MVDFHTAAVFENLPESTHVVVVGMRNKPSLNLVAESADKAAEEESLVGAAAVEYNHFAGLGLEYVGVADVCADIGRYLPHGERRFGLGFLL